MSETFIDSIGLFLVLRDRRRQRWIEPPKFPHAITDSIRALEKILSGGQLRHLDRLGEVIQPARRSVFRRIKTIVRGYLRR